MTASADFVGKSTGSLSAGVPAASVTLARPPNVTFRNVAERPVTPASAIATVAAPTVSGSLLASFVMRKMRRVPPRLRGNR